MNEYFKMANVEYENNKYENAFKLYIKDIEKEGASASNLYNAGVCLLKLRRFSDAIYYLKEAIGYKRDSKYFFNLGYCYAMNNNKKLALQYFNTAWSYNNNDEDSEKAIKVILDSIIKNKKK